MSDQTVDDNQGSGNLDRDTGSPASPGVDPNHAPEKISDAEYSRIESLRRNIDEYYEMVPHRLRDLPDAQGKCLELMSRAEQLLTPPITRRSIIDAKLALARLEIEMRRSQSARTSFMVVVVVVYIFAAAVGAAIASGLLSTGATADEMNERLFMGVPLPIWIWGVIGSLTSMLLRAGYFPFTNRTEALRWLLFRPIVGVVMGVMTYLMVVAGLIVFAGSPTTQTPELLWIIAFVGSFSDDLSVNLLRRVVGKFQMKELSTQEDGGSQEESNDGVETDAAR